MYLYTVIIHKMGQSEPDKKVQFTNYSRAFSYFAELCDAYGYDYPHGASFSELQAGGSGHDYSIYVTAEAI